MFSSGQRAQPQAAVASKTIYYPLNDTANVIELPPKKSTLTMSSGPVNQHSKSLSATSVNLPPPLPSHGHYVNHSIPPPQPVHYQQLMHIRPNVAINKSKQQPINSDYEIPTQYLSFIVRNLYLSLSLNSSNYCNSFSAGNSTFNIKFIKWN